MATKKLKLLDSFAILRWTQKEKGWKRIKSLLESAKKGTEALIMSQINLCEVHYKSIRVIGLDKARKFLETFFLLPITIIHPSDELIWKAAEIKAEHPISLADCFAIATALKNKATPLLREIRNSSLSKNLLMSNGFNPFSIRVLTAFVSIIFSKHKKSAE